MYPRLVYDGEGKFAGVATTTAFTTGLAQRVRDIGKIQIYATATGGVVSGGSDTSAIGTFSGAVDYPLKRGWSLLFSVRGLTSSLSDFRAVYGLMLCWGK